MSGKSGSFFMRDRHTASRNPINKPVIRILQLSSFKLSQRFPCYAEIIRHLLLIDMFLDSAFFYGIL